MTSPGAGRYRGSLARHRATIARTGCGTSSSVGSAYTTRYASASVRPSPNGPRPVAAKVSTAPSAKTSAAGPVSPPVICSGAMNPAEPRIVPVLVSELCSAARAIPKSITRGPSAASSTFDGFRSRCTTPAAWIAWSASARPRPSRSTAGSGSGPPAVTASDSDGPATYSTASHGRSAAVSASTTDAV